MRVVGRPVDRSRCRPARRRDNRTPRTRRFRDRRAAPSDHGRWSIRRSAAAACPARSRTTARPCRDAACRRCDRRRSARGRRRSAPLRGGSERRAPDGTGTRRNRRSPRSPGRRQQLLVHHDPVADLQPRRGGQLAVRHDPDADQHEIGAEPLAARPIQYGRPGRRGAAGKSGNPHGLGAETEFDTGAAVRLGEELRGRNRDHPAHDPVGQFDDLDRLAAGARDGGKFEADETGADHDDPVRPRQAAGAARRSRPA